jgi:ribosomal protein L4
MELKLIGNDGQSAENISASDALFGREYNEALVHQLVTAYMANARSANRAQKGRSDVNKSTRGVHVQAWPPAHCGVVVVRYSLVAQMIISVIK